MTMESLPFELHTQIFEFACTDDGATARALALVSRYVRDAGSPFLFQSLSVSGLSQMDALLARLHALPPHARRIRHLFLSDWTRKGMLKGGEPFAEMERYDRERVLAARILEYASPTLETLALVAACPYTAAPLVGHLFALSLPRLEELAIHGFYPFPQSHDTANGGLPRLTRLHLSGNRNPHGLLQLGALEAACPTLTHLRVSEVAGAAAFARELYEAALPRPSSEDERGAVALSVSPFPSALPAHLRELVIEARRPPEPVPSPTQHRHHHRAGVKRGVQGAHEKMMALLREVELRRAETRLETVEVVEGDGVDMFEVLKRDWLARLQPQRQL